MNNQQKTFLIIKQGLSVGGTETLTARMCNWLVSNGHKVTLLTESRVDKLQVSDSVNRIVSDLDFYRILKPKIARQYIAKYGFSDVDVIYGYGPIELMVSLSLGRFINKAKILTGVYHSMAYMKSSRGKIYNYFLQKLLKGFQEENILFMNDFVKCIHEVNLKRSFSSSQIWPLPVSVKKYIREHKRTNTIISVGNLKGFKTYNITMLDVIFELRKKGYDVYYEIYGDGPLRSEMESKIKSLELGKYVFMKGQIPYECLTETVRRGFVFVGLGTAVLEAAISSVPSISSVSYSKESLTFGYVHQMPRYNVGTPIEGYPYKEIIDLIEHLLTADYNTYNALRFKDYSFVKNNFDEENVMKLFIKFVNASKVVKYSSHVNNLRFLYWIEILYTFRRKAHDLFNIAQDQGTD